MARTPLRRWTSGPDGKLRALDAKLYCNAAALSGTLNVLHALWWDIDLASKNQRQRVWSIWMVPFLLSHGHGPVVKLPWGCNLGHVEPAHQLPGVRLPGTTEPVGDEELSDPGLTTPFIHQPNPYHSEINTSTCSC